MENEKPNYYAIIPADVRYDNDLKSSEKLLYGEITALTKKTGECWASNNHFAKLYNVTPQAVSRWIINLSKKGYLKIEYEYGNKNIEKRIIKVSTYIDRGINICLGGYQQKVEENNTSINNTSIKERNIKERKIFKKPTIDEIKDYCKERNNGINAETFYDFYESKDWYVGKNKMKGWKACIRTWEQRNKVKTIENKSDVPTWFNQEIKLEKNEDENIKELISKYE